MEIISTLCFLLLCLNSVPMDYNSSYNNTDFKHVDKIVLNKNNKNTNYENVECEILNCKNMSLSIIKTSNLLTDSKNLDRDTMECNDSTFSYHETNKMSSNESYGSHTKSVKDTSDSIDNTELKVSNVRKMQLILKTPQNSIMQEVSYLTSSKVGQRNSNGKCITLFNVFQIVYILWNVSQMISLQYRLCEPHTSKSYFHKKINLKILPHDLFYLDMFLQTLYFDTAIKEVKDKMTKSEAFFDRQEDFQHFQWIFEPTRHFPAFYYRNFTAFPAIQHVLSRLASFRSIVKDLITTPVSPNRLSQSGFGYNGTGTTVTCEECGKLVELSCFIRGYDMADPSDSMFHNHGCSYVANSQADVMTDSSLSNPNSRQDKTSITIPVMFPSVSSKHKANGLTSPPAKEQEFQILLGENTSNIDTLEGSFDRQPYPEASQNFGIFHPSLPDHSRQSNAISEQACEGNASGGQGQVDSGQTPDKETEQTTVFKVLSQPTYPTYIAYQKRLESFALWLFYHIATPMFLARAGFFYAGYADCVRCFQCGLGLRSWKVGDNVYDEHKKHRPQCPFLQAQVMAGVPTTETFHQTAMPISEVSSPVLPSNNTERLSMPLTQQSVMIPSQQTFVSYTPSDQPTNSSIAPQDTSQSSSLKTLKLKLLQDENTKLQEQQLCKVCFVAPCRDLFLPCGDLYACADCSKLLTHCPLCSKQILATVTTYLT